MTPNNRQSFASTIPAQSTPSSRLFIVAVCVLYRWLNAYLTRTYDNPDEYWQSLEVAHRLVFDYGYLTWEWAHGIRSYFHPLVFATCYKILQWCHLDQPSLLISVPRYLQATLSAMGDVATYTLAKKLYGNRIAPFILFVTLGSWFHFLMAARTLSNTMETALTIIALKDWPFPGVPESSPASSLWLKRYRKSLFWASIACIIRPTNAMIWAFLGLQLLYSTPQQYRWTVLSNAGFIVTFLMMMNVILDTAFYRGHLSLQPQDFVLVPWTFVKTNIFQSMALFYGAHPFHWYLSQGLPLMLFTYLPLTIVGMISNSNNNSQTSPLVHLVVWVVAIYSLLSHKEFRFIYPVFPVLLILTAHGLSVIWHKLLKWKWIVVLTLWLTQLALALYVSLCHQRGVMDVMTWLSQQQQQQEKSSSSIGFLMPCHSTPWHSAMHQPSTAMWFLTCEPPLDNANPVDYTDQADLFYQDPIPFLSNLPYDWPDYLVVFEHLLSQPGIQEKLMQEKGYKECQRFFNSHVHWDERRKGDVVVLCVHK